MWVAQYSSKRGCYHVTTLEVAVSMNRRMVLNKESGDHTIFGVYETDGQARAACHRMQRHHAKRIEGGGGKKLQPSGL